jgi:hypothetical protein
MNFPHNVKARADLTDAGLTERDLLRTLTGMVRVISDVSGIDLSSFLVVIKEPERGGEPVAASADTILDHVDKLLGLSPEDAKLTRIDEGGTIQ